MSYDELRGDREFLRCKTQGLFSHLERYAFDFKDDATGRDGEYITYRITLTLTHSDIGRFLRDRLVRKYADPALSLTLHITCHGYTSGLYLAAGKPVCIQALYSEATERKLVTTLSVALAATFLRSAIFGSFRL